MKKAQAKPRSLLLSKRANVFYLEHVRVMQKDGRIIWINDRRGDQGPELEPYFNLPERNTVFVLLGKGSSITDAAARRLAEAGVIVGFCGSGGSPLFSMAETVFLTPQSEYRPTEYMQAWVRMWFDEPVRLCMARRFLQRRLEWTLDAWSGDKALLARGIVLDDATLRAFQGATKSGNDTQSLLLAEAQWAKALYKRLARGYSLPEFSRKEGLRQNTTVEERINGFLDHGNYIAYGYAAAVLYTLGISFAFPVLHGKTRRGGLVFDLADLIKDAYVMPLAFAMGNEGAKPQMFRAVLIELCQEREIVDALFSFVKKALEEISINQ
jgi:CRISPR-associated protein Cas1